MLHSPLLANNIKTNTDTVDSIFSICYACPSCPIHRAFSFAPIALITARAIFLFNFGVSSFTSFPLTNLLIVYSSFIQSPPHTTYFDRFVHYESIYNSIRNMLIRRDVTALSKATICVIFHPCILVFPLSTPLLIT